ncbi:MAG: tetratricopeptide repeat protein [Desulfovibrionaceae bacterium]|nr:tetratricopeptide repeat protein [Desulfovibrionaceae bacterium]
MSRLKMVGMLNRAGMKSFNEGRTADALFQLVQADRLARSMKSPLQQAKVRNNIGLVHQGVGNHEEALACFRLAARNAVKGAGEGNVLHKAIVRNMARLEDGKAEQAA